MPKAELEAFAGPGGEIVRGNRLPFTPEWNVNGFVDYRVPLDRAELLFQLNASYQSEVFFDQNQNPFTRQSGYTLFNGRIAYETEHWTAALWGKNLSNRGYSNLRFDLINFLGLVQDNRGEERQLGVDLTYRF
jgi:iron complex outermembrane receptor protein